MIRKRAAPLLVCVFLLWTPQAEAGAVDVVVTSPWLALLVNFIGGVNVKAASILEWNDEGDLARRIRPRALQALPPERLILAFDDRDAQNAGLSGRRKNLRTLYAHLPINEEEIDVSLSDPSVIPFIAQRVLIALAAWDPGSYPYYQRRLAEFQARLYSTTLAGRQILKDQPIYDLSGHSGPLLQAAGCKLTRPSPEELAAWGAWREIGLLTAAVSRAAEDKITVVLDGSTPKAIRHILASDPAIFSIPRPRPDQDYPAFLHDQYISLWSKISSKPLPPQEREKRR